MLQRTCSHRESGEQQETTTTGRTPAFLRSHILLYAQNEFDARSRRLSLKESWWKPRTVVRLSQSFRMSPARLMKVRVVGQWTVLTEPTSSSNLLRYKKVHQFFDLVIRHQSHYRRRPQLARIALCCRSCIRAAQCLMDKGKTTFKLSSKIHLSVAVLGTAFAVLGAGLIPRLRYPRFRSPHGDTSI